MKPSCVTLAYFSATNTTKKITRAIAGTFGEQVIEFNITLAAPQEEVCVKKEELLVVGVPVYAGRVPAICVESLQQFKGDNTPDVIVCVYGNREYDDALLELKDLVESNGFRVVSAGAFIAQHSIFPQVAENRPDEADMKKIKEFGEATARLLDTVTAVDELPLVTVEGNNSYKPVGKVPLHPKGNRKCTACGACVKQCPAKAISPDEPRKTDEEKCISCGRCIVVCPQEARKFRGLIYSIGRRRFVKANSVRKEPWVSIDRESNSGYSIL